MDKLIIENLSFAYPGKSGKTLCDISLEISQGEYIVIAGKSGCGKTTLLRHLKPALTPHGKRSGRILIGGRELKQMSEREQAQKIGFVMQDPDSQIVTDKVWHELAFGLENLGFDRNTIRLRVAEMAAYFGIDEWFDCEVGSLSGGQKQLLNLAAVMAMHPDVLILDEPVSQLDPVAASDFLDTVAKINRELGVTVILTEHRLEEIFSFADKIAVMDSGRIVSFESPQRTGEKLSFSLSFIRYAMPVPMKIYAEVGDTSLPCPVNIREGRKWLSEILPEMHDAMIENEEPPISESVITLRDIHFKYDKKGKTVLNDLSASFQGGKITAVLGGNGAGKSTLLKIIAGICKPQAGKIKCGKMKIAYLPQHVQTVFTEKTVRADLLLMDENIGEVVSLTDIQDILASHPFDISGGEMQRAALAKILLTSPDVLLLDEPTKGMDGGYKEKFAEILKSLAAKGKTVILVSHDIEFCASYADVCMMLFGGKIAAQNHARSFFSGNTFYTTAASRMSRSVFENAVTAEEVAYLCKKNLKKPEY